MSEYHGYAAVRCVQHSLALQFQIIRALLAVSTKEEGIPCDAVSLAAVDRQDIFEW